MYKLDVYFDFVEIGNDVEVGALIVDDGEIVESSLKMYEGVRERGNNYHFSILAWTDAVKLVNKYISEEGDIFDGITFCNQNQLIFKWAESGKCPVDYEKGIEKLYGEVQKLVDSFNLEFTFKTIKGKDNKVKKILKKRKDKKMATTEQKMSFGNLKNKSTTSHSGKRVVESKMGNSPNNVVNIMDKKKVNEA